MALRALYLGDLLTGVPALRALADAFPDHRRVLAAPEAVAPLALLSGAVHEVRGTAELAPLDPSLHRADVAVDLHGSGPETHRLLLATGPRRLIAFQHPEIPETRGAPAWRDGEHEARRWCRLLAGHGIAADPSRLDLPAPPRRPHPRAVGATVIHPGAAFPSRRWPPERFAAVARHEARDGRSVVVTGSRREVGLARRVASAAGLGRGSVLAGRTDLLELAAVVAAADRVVCGDTGVAHLATALRTPSVVLFGPVPPSEWGPPADRAWHVPLWAGRRGDPHGDRVDPGLLAIDTETVIAALEGLPPPVLVPGRPALEPPRGLTRRVARGSGVLT